MGTNDHLHTEPRGYVPEQKMGPGYMTWGSRLGAIAASEGNEQSPRAGIKPKRYATSPDAKSEQPLYHLWENIKQRCTNEHHRDAERYGKRAITMYSPWVNDSDAFMEWIETNLGARPDGYSLDRIDNNGNYEPGNLQWATRTQQSRNRRCVKLNEEAVKVIRYLARKGVARARLTKAYGITRATVSDILRGRSWGSPRAEAAKQPNGKKAGGESRAPLLGIGGAPIRATTIPTEAAERKKYPLATGVLDYFPDALLEIARVSWEGNEQHHPGQPLHWDRSKSADEADAMMRHFSQRGTRDTDGRRHTAKAAWRILALLQKEIEAEN